MKIRERSQNYFSELQKDGWISFVGFEIIYVCLDLSKQLLKVPLTVPLSTQVHKRVPVNLMLAVTLQWTSIPSREE